MTTRMNRRGFLATTGAAAGALSFLGPKALHAQDGGTLRFGLSTYPPSLDAWASNGTAAGTIKLMIHRGLLGYGPDGMMRGELAESWEVDDEGAWVFKLRDATWHDGTPVTAEDIAWNVLEAQKPDSAAYLQGQLASITSVETPDEKTGAHGHRRAAGGAAGLVRAFQHADDQEGRSPRHHHGLGPVPL